jgi:hypothetical protein
MDCTKAAKILANCRYYPQATGVRKPRPKPVKYPQATGVRKRRPKPVKGKPVKKMFESWSHMFIDKVDPTQKRVKPTRSITPTPVQGKKRITPMMTAPVQGNLMKKGAKTKGLNEYSQMLQDLEARHNVGEAPKIDNLLSREDLLDRSSSINVDMRDAPMQYQNFSGQQRFDDAVDRIYQRYARPNMRLTPLTVTG